MKAVNLIPGDGRGSGFSTDISLGPAYVLLGLLAIAVVFVTLYVLTSNTISQRKSQIAQVRAQTAQERVQAAHLANYVKFAQLAQARAKTVKDIAMTRFDWHGTLENLSKVVPVDTSLQSLSGSVAPQATSAGSSGGGSGASAQLRSAVDSPAFELTGCSKTQDDVARLISRLRVINGVTRVTLGDSVKSQTAQAGGAVSGTGGTSPSKSSTQAVGCGTNAPTFDLVVFFKPLSGADPTTGAPSQPVSATAGTGATTGASGASASTTPPASTATPTSTPPVTGGTP